MMSESRTELKIIEVPNSDDALWDEFVTHSPQGTFFQRSSWVNKIGMAFNRSSRRFFCIRNEQPIGGLIFYERRKMFWHLATPTPLFPFTAPLFYKPHDERHQKTLSNYLNISSAFGKYLEDHLAYWVLDAPHTFPDPRSFMWQGASVEPRYTYIIKLSSEEEMVNRFNQSTRKKLKLAEKEDPRMIESNDPSDLIQLIIKSYRRHNRSPLIPENILLKALNSLLDLPEVRIFYLSLRDQIKSARLIVEDRQTVYDVLAGSDDDTGVASAYLISRILIKFGKSHQSFDFMGADHPEIEQFKRGFGGDLKQGFRISAKVHFPLSIIIKLREHYLNKKRDI